MTQKNKVLDSWLMTSKANDLTTPKQLISFFLERELHRGDIWGEVRPGDQLEEASGLRNLLHDLDQTLHHRNHSNASAHLLQLQGNLQRKFKSCSRECDRSGVSHSGLAHCQTTEDVCMLLLIKIVCFL